MTHPFSIATSMDSFIHTSSARAKGRFDRSCRLRVLRVGKVSMHGLLNSDIVKFGSHATVYGGKI